MLSKTSTKTLPVATEKTVPRHLGIIMDGNRRWAVQNGLPKTEGHRKGWETLKAISYLLLDRGVQYFSVYAFSTENWSRSKEEVGYLMNLLLWVSTHEIDELHSKNIKLQILGSTEGVAPKVMKALRAAEVKTAGNTAGTLCMCFNYGGQQEIADATKNIIAAGVKPDNVTPELISQYLYAPEIPPLDLVIRTSGEQRLSNFMLWRSAYAELLFVEKHWPDFNESDLDAALAEYSNRSRRFGK